MNLGKAIKMIRVKRDMSQEDLAVAAGVTGGYISLLERNKRDPGMALVKKLADALTVPVSVMIYFADNDIKELYGKGVDERVSSVMLIDLLKFTLAD